MTQPDDEDEARRAKSNLLMAAAFIVIAILGVWLAYALYQNLQQQKCILEGRHDCAPIAIPQGN